MIKQKNGYTLGVLVITIAIMIILTTVAIINFKSISSDKDITYFMNDISEIEEFIKTYYSETGVLPIKNDNNNDPIELSADNYELIMSQVTSLDTGNFYMIDIEKLGKIRLSDRNRNYIVNENSLKVFVLKPINYQGIDYYTITDELKGYEKTYNDSQNFEILISGNPSTWASFAKLMLSIPNEENVSNKWTFKYYMPGPITAEDFKNSGEQFIYGEDIIIRENGIVTFYAVNEEGFAKTINVVISNIDDIPPKIEISGDRTESGELKLIDNETGINPNMLVYKIIGQDESGEMQSATDGRLLLEYGTNYSTYIEEYNELSDRYNDLQDEITLQERIRKFR